MIHTLMLAPLVMALRAPQRSPPLSGTALIQGDPVTAPLSLVGGAYLGRGPRHEHMTPLFLVSLGSNLEHARITVVALSRKFGLRVAW